MKVLRVMLLVAMVTQYTNADGYGGYGGGYDTGYSSYHSYGGGGGKKFDFGALFAKKSRIFSKLKNKIGTIFEKVKKPLLRFKGALLKKGGQLLANKGYQLVSLGDYLEAKYSPGFGGYGGGYGGYDSGGGYGDYEEVWPEEVWTNDYTDSGYGNSGGSVGFGQSGGSGHSTGFGHSGVSGGFSASNSYSGSGHSVGSGGHGGSGHSSGSGGYGGSQHSVGSGGHSGSGHASGSGRGYGGFSGSNSIGFTHSSGGGLHGSSGSHGSGSPHSPSGSSSSGGYSGNGGGNFATQGSTSPHNSLIPNINTAYDANFRPISLQPAGFQSVSQPQQNNFIAPQATYNNFQPVSSPVLQTQQQGFRPVVPTLARPAVQQVYSNPSTQGVVQVQQGYNIPQVNEAANVGQTRIVNNPNIISQQQQLQQAYPQLKTLTTLRPVFAPGSGTVVQNFSPLPLRSTTGYFTSSVTAVNLGGSTGQNFAQPVRQTGIANAAVSNAIGSNQVAEQIQNSVAESSTLGPVREVGVSQGIISNNGVIQAGNVVSGGLQQNVQGQQQVLVSTNQQGNLLSTGAQQLIPAGQQSSFVPNGNQQTFLTNVVPQQGTIVTNQQQPFIVNTRPQGTIINSNQQGYVYPNAGLTPNLQVIQAQPQQLAYNFPNANAGLTTSNAQAVEQPGFNVQKSKNSVASSSSLTGPSSAEGISSSSGISSSASGAIVSEPSNVDIIASGSQKDDVSSNLVQEESSSVDIESVGTPEVTTEASVETTSEIPPTIAELVNTLSPLAISVNEIDSSDDDRVSDDTTESSVSTLDADDAVTIDEGLFKLFQSAQVSASDVDDSSNEPSNGNGNFIVDGMTFDENGVFTLELVQANPEPSSLQSSQADFDIASSDVKISDLSRGGRKIASAPVTVDLLASNSAEENLDYAEGRSFDVGASIDYGGFVPLNYDYDYSDYQSGSHLDNNSQSGASAVDDVVYADRSAAEFAALLAAPELQKDFLPSNGKNSEYEDQDGIYNWQQWLPGRFAH